MIYFVIELQTMPNNVAANIVTSYYDRAEAERQYYLALAAAAVSTLPVHAAALLTNDGTMIMHKSYTHAQVK